MYPDASRRNSVVNKLYDFTNSFGNSPVSIVNYKAKNKIVPIFQIKRFNIDAKKELVTEIVENGKIEKEEHAVASVKLRTNNKGKTTRIIEQLYKKSATTLSYSPDVIVFENKVYNLHFPLRSSLLKEDDYFVIHNEMLDIIGTGITEDDAEKSFAEEFDFIYKRYNQIEEINLSDKLKKIKYFLNYIVKSIE